MTYQQLIIRDLQDLYQAETQQASQLTQFAGQANNPALRSALEDHVNETQQQALRLREILETLDQTPGGEGEVSPGVRGLEVEAQQKSQQTAADPVLKDLALIAAAQKMEHYEIASYGTARAMARTAGMANAARLLQTTLDEEEAADKRLTEVALPLHKQAAQAEPAIAQ